MPESAALARFIERLSADHGLDLRGYKLSTLERRIRKRMAQLNLNDYEAYIEVLKQDEGEETTLLNTILINVTEFFRDPQAWEILRTEALPKLVRRLKPGDVLRCWSVGCASGEEPYSLAIVLAELLSAKLTDFDVKIYGTDIDDDALRLARRGEYSAHELRRIPLPLRERYFVGSGPFRISRELRRMVIFGHTNVLLDAPISHCNLIVCRNLLIYFDSEAQRQIAAKLHYALEPAGILFLGSSEAKLNDSQLFDQLDPRWRIFQKRSTLPERGPGAGEVEPLEGDRMQVNQEQARMQKELSRLRLHQRYLLETLKSSVLVLDAEHTIVSGNDATHAVWGVALARLIGRRLQNSELARLAPELLEKMGLAGPSDGTGELSAQRLDDGVRREGDGAPAGGRESSEIGQRERSLNEPSSVVELTCRLTVGGEERIVAVIVRPIAGDDGEWNGSLLYAEDMTYRRRLQQTVRQLEHTSSELQSANEELETTNEELQSTNEELETTNEELQSTNEELETTNEELQSVNEELENMNEELETRTRELKALSARYADTLQRMPWPVLMTDVREDVQMWNAAAQTLLDVHPANMTNLKLERLPIEPAMLKAMVRCARKAASSKEAQVLRDQKFASNGVGAEAQTFDVHFTPVLQSGSEVEGVMIMFGPPQSSAAKQRKSAGQDSK